MYGFSQHVHTMKWPPRLAGVARILLSNKGILANTKRSAPNQHSCLSRPSKRFSPYLSVSRAKADLRRTLPHNYRTVIRSIGGHAEKIAPSRSPRPFSAVSGVQRITSQPFSEELTPTTTAPSPEILLAQLGKTPPGRSPNPIRNGPSSEAAEALNRAPHSMKIIACDNRVCLISASAISPLPVRQPAQRTRPSLG